MDTKCVILKRVWSVVLAAAGLFTAPLSATLQAQEAAQTAQADDVSLLEDGDITVGTAGHYYVNMPVTGTNTLTITADGITAGKGTFKVYDNGGKGGNYSDGCNGTLVLTAPTGYVLQLSGDIYTEAGRDKLNIYDNSNTSGTPLLINVSSSSSGTNTDITTVTSLSNVMTIYFSSDNSGNYAGLDLTVIISKDESTNSESTNSEYTYNYLIEQIGSGGDVKLVRGTYTYGDGDGDTSEINSGVIDGNGSVIDMAGSGYRAFEIKGSGVTIKNLTIKNANFNGKGGAIYFDEQGTVENCTFIDNEASEDGGAVYFNDRGTVTNCTFTGNKATGDGCYGGAVYIYGNGNVKNCIFADNSACGAGAVLIKGNGSVTNCDFINNTATTTGGGAIWFGSNGTVKDCNYTGNEASKDGGGVYFDSQSTVTNCNFVNNSAEEGGSIYASNGIVLDWTNPTDFIFASSYGVGDGKVIKTADGKRFVAYTVDNTNPESPVETPVAIIAGTVSDLSTIDGKMLRPLDGYFVAVPEGLDIVGRTPDFVIGSVSYYQIAANENVTVEVIQQGVKFTGTDMPAGTTFNDDYTQATFTMPASTDVAITDIRYYTTEVAYIDADGNQATTPTDTKVYVLGGTEKVLGKDGEDTWYVALPADENGGRDLTGYGNLTLLGNVHLILADGAEMKAAGDVAIENYVGAGLTLYGQSAQTGVLTAEGTAENFFAILISGADLVINGGSLTAKGNYAEYDITIVNGNLTVNGGTIFDTRNLKITDGNAIINGGRLIGHSVIINPGQEDSHTLCNSTLYIVGGDITVTGGDITGFILDAREKSSTGGHLTISGGTLDSSSQFIDGNVSTTVSGGKIMAHTLGNTNSPTSLSLSNDDGYIRANAFDGAVSIPQGSYLGDGERVFGSADADYLFGADGHATIDDIKEKTLVKATPLATGGLYLVYDNPSGASLLTAGTVALYPTGIKFTEQADGSFTAEVVLSDQPLPGIPKGRPVILASATDGAPLSDVWLMGSNALSGEDRTPEALKDGYDARTDRLMNFVAADGTQTVAQLIAEATGRTAVTDADCSDYIIFVLSSDRFVAASATPDVIPAAGRCLLVVPKLNMLRHLDMGDTSGGTTAGARTLRLGGADSATTGINEIGAIGDASGDTYFGLDGRKLYKAPKAKGIYIHRGKMVVVK